MGMWGVYPEAMDWNVGAMHSEINLGECIWRSGHKGQISKCTLILCIPQKICASWNFFKFWSEASFIQMQIKSID